MSFIASPSSLIMTSFEFSCNQVKNPRIQIFLSIFFVFKVKLNIFCDFDSQKISDWSDWSRMDRSGNEGSALYAVMKSTFYAQFIKFMQVKS